MRSCVVRLGVSRRGSRPSLTAGALGHTHDGAPTSTDVTLINHHYFHVSRLTQSESLGIEARAVTAYARLETGTGLSCLASSRSILSLGGNQHHCAIHINTLDSRCTSRVIVFCVLFLRAGASLHRASPRSSQTQHSRCFADS